MILEWHEKIKCLMQLYSSSFLICLVIQLAGKSAQTYEKRLFLGIFRSLGPFFQVFE